MEILSVNLTNFKSHRDRHFIFQPGTNAICGENGAGKTSILEAIAWVLFDYRGRYNVEDLIHNDSASAQARITFVSNLDQRTYEVSRCTRTGYTIYDPQLGEKLEYKRIQEEVMPWLRQQFGVAPGTNLAELFANTIGVPQGMFTADFLKPDKDRKETFDKVLKVDEYRKVYEKLLPLNKQAEMIVASLKKDIDRYEEDLEKLDTLQQKRQVQNQEIAQVEADLQHYQIQLEQLQTEQTQLETLATQIRQLETQQVSLQPRIQDQISQVERLQSELKQAETAVAICTGHREAYQAFLQAETTIQELEQQRSIEQNLRQQQRQQEKQFSDRQLQLQALTLQLEDLKTAETSITELELSVQEQVQLEQAQQNLAQQIQHCFAARQALKTQETQLAKLQTRHTQLSQEITRIRTFETTVQQIPALERQQQRCQQQLSRIAAATQFEADLQQLFTQAQTTGDRYLAQVQHAEAALRELQRAVPNWAEVLNGVLYALYSGRDWQQQLTTALAEILSDLAEQTAVAKLEQQLQHLHLQLQTARRQQAELANLDRLLADQQEIEAAIADLQMSLTELRSRLAAEPTLQQQQTQLAQALTALNDPRGQCHLLQQKLKQQSKLQRQMAEVQATVTEKQQAIATLETQLVAFADLPAAVQQQQAIKEQHRVAYEAYLLNRDAANRRKEWWQQLQAATNQLQQLEQEAQNVSEQRDRLSQSFDPTHYQTVQAAYQSAKAQQIALNARLPDMRKYLAELDEQLARLQGIQEQRDRAQAELENSCKVERFVKFARKAYKEAGPRITERYVHSISHEADKLFRELLNRPNVGLQWSRDYEILVQEGAHTRRFINLSGGEQMCAALAVRLALLKVLADIDIAFFDEPTTNMDRSRREHLAEAIANIKTFRQLFVISHDDTFEKVTENIIVIEREV
jgi:exonuclease SbcC